MLTTLQFHVPGCTLSLAEKGIINTVAPRCGTCMAFGAGPPVWEEQCNVLELRQQRGEIQMVLCVEWLELPG